MEFIRRGGAAGPWLLGGWLAASLLAAGPALAWHLDYFQSPGPQFHRIVLLAAPALFALAVAYGWLRPQALRKAEPWLLTGLAVVAPLAWKPLAASSALLLLCAALALGGALLQRLDLTLEQPLERFVLSAGIGFALLIAALLGLGLVHGFRMETFAALLLLPPLLLFRALRRCVEDAAASLRRWSSSAALDHPMAGMLTAFAFPFLGIVLALALAPALAHDALMMHLPAVRSYLAAGGLEPLPHLSYTYFPQGAELLMTAAAGLGGLAAAQLVQPLFFALALGAIACVAARAGVSPLSRYAGVVAAATLPFLAWTGGVAKNDMALALFQALSLLCVTAAQGPQRRTWLRLGVFFLAASFSVKYTAAFGAAPLGLLLAWRGRSLERKVRELLLWAALFAALAGAWQLRAYLLTGNPYYPVELSWAVESLRPNSMRPPEWRSVPYWKIPWTIHFDGTKAFESPSANPAGFFLWLFGPLWLLVRRKQASAAETFCLAFAWIYFFYWGSVWPVVRYTIVPFALLITLTAQRLEAAWGLLPRAWAPALATVLSANGVACLLAAMTFSLNAPQLQLFSGGIGEQEYLRRTLVTYPVLERLSREWKPGDWTISAGLASAAYAPDPARFQCERLVDPAAARELVPALLAERTYAFLIVRADENGAAIVRELPSGVSGEQLFEDAHFALYRLAYSTTPVPQ